MLAALPALALVLPLWRVEAVTVASCVGLPRATRTGLERLGGEWVPLLDLHWVRHQAAQWPGVAGVEVELRLPGTLVVTAHPAVAAGSLATGRRWHAVTAAGEVGGALSAPVTPLLEGFGTRPADLHAGLAAASRLARSTGRAPTVVRRVLHDDILVVLAPSSPDGAPLEVHVAPDGSASERRFCALLADGSLDPSWADLRSDERMTLRNAS